MKIVEAIKLGVTAFTQSVKSPDKTILLRPASNNNKIGKGEDIISKGKWAGYPLFTLTFEERKTCPTSCHHFSTCYGNNAPFMHRVDTSNEKFLLFLLKKEIKALAKKYPLGFVIRLHVLGDFFSVSYVNFWVKMLRKYSNLHIYGYTARKEGAIFSALLNLFKFKKRVWIRISSNPFNNSYMYASKAENNVEGIICPEQTGKTNSCLTCGLCWSTKKNILFQQH